MNKVARDPALFRLAVDSRMRGYVFVKLSFSGFIHRGRFVLAVAQESVVDSIPQVLNSLY